MNDASRFILNFALSPHFYPEALIDEDDDVVFASLEFEKLQPLAIMWAIFKEEV